MRDWNHILVKLSFLNPIWKIHLLVDFYIQLFSLLEYDFFNLLSNIFKVD